MGYQNFPRPEFDPEKTRSDLDDTRVDLSDDDHATFVPEDTLADEKSGNWHLKTRVDDDSNDGEPITDDAQIYMRTEDTKGDISDMKLDALWDEVDIDTLSFGDDVETEEDDEETGEGTPAALHESIGGLEYASHPLPMMLAMELSTLQNNASERQIGAFIRKMQSGRLPYSRSEISLVDLFLSDAISDVDISSSGLVAGEYIAGEVRDAALGSLEKAGEKMYRYMITQEGAIVILSFDTRQETCSIEHTITETIREDAA
jgi:hypothetical protein